MSRIQDYRDNLVVVVVEEKKDDLLELLPILRKNHEFNLYL